MSKENIARVHWGFWAIGAIALIWNVLGCVNLVLQMNADMVASFPETHRAIIEGRPAWATLGFAVGVFGGALGSIFLLLRKLAAYYLFVVSLFGVVVTMIHTLRIVVSVVEFTSFEISMMIASPMAMAAFLIWYAKHAASKGWIS